jgi:hypothetical protein
MNLSPRTFVDGASRIAALRIHGRLQETGVRIP